MHLIHTAAVSFSFVIKLFASNVYELCLFYYYFHYRYFNIFAGDENVNIVGNFDILIILSVCLCSNSYPSEQKKNILIAAYQLINNNKK